MQPNEFPTQGLEGCVIVRVRKTQWAGDCESGQMSHADKPGFNTQKRCGNPDVVVTIYNFSTNIMRLNAHTGVSSLSLSHRSPGVCHAVQSKKDSALTRWKERS